MSAYIGLIYSGQPDIGKIKSMARQHGAYDLALHVTATGSTLINVHSRSINKGFTPKTWGHDQLEEAIAYYDRLKDRSPKQSPRCIIVYSGIKDKLPQSLDITMLEVERPQEKPVPQTPLEQWEALFKK